MSQIKWILAYLCLQQIRNIKSLSACHPVDSIFLMKSSLIIHDEQQNNVESFLHDLSFEASSERSGIGLIIYDKLPQYPYNNTVLKLSDTKYDYSTKHTIQTIHDRCIENNFELFYNNQLMNNTTNIISLETAFIQSHEMFTQQSSNTIQQALFILDDSYSNLHICKSFAKTHKYDYMERIYFVYVNEQFDLEFIYDCIKQEEIINYDVLEDIYEITCPTTLPLRNDEQKRQNRQTGINKFNKKTQLIEPCVILSCDIHNTVDDTTNSVRTLPTSTIIVEDSIYDEMSYEIGYILIAWNYVFTSFPDGCILPVMKIIDIEQISNDNHNKSRILRLNITEPMLLEYMNNIHVSATNAKVYGKHVQKNDYKCEKKKEKKHITKKEKTAIAKRRSLIFSCLSLAIILPECIAEAVSFSLDIYGVGEEVEELVDDLLTFESEIDISFGITGGIPRTQTRVAVNSPKNMHGWSFSGVGTIDVFADYGFIVKATPKFVSDIDYTDNGFEIKELTFELEGTMDINFDFELDFAGSIISTADIDKYLTTLPMIIVVAGVPFTVHPRLKVTFNFELASVGINIDYHFDQHKYFKFGLSYTSINGPEIIKGSTPLITTSSVTANIGSSGRYIYDMDDNSCTITNTRSIFIRAFFGADLFGAVFTYIQFMPKLTIETVFGSKCENDIGYPIQCTNDKYPVGMLIHPKLTFSLSIGISKAKYWDKFLPGVKVNLERYIIKDQLLKDFTQAKKCDVTKGIFPLALSCCPENDFPSLHICSNEKISTIQNDFKLQLEYEADTSTTWQKTNWYSFQENGNNDDSGYCKIFDISQIPATQKITLHLVSCGSSTLNINFIKWWDMLTSEYKSISQFGYPLGWSIKSSHDYCGTSDYFTVKNEDCSTMTVSLNDRFVFVNIYDTSICSNGSEIMWFRDMYLVATLTTLIFMILFNIFCCYCDKTYNNTYYKKYMQVKIIR
eukprot:8213_1